MTKNVTKDSLEGNKSSMAESPKGQAVSIEKGRIVNVNIRDYTVDVRTEFTYKTITDLAFMVPYCHTAQGEGINFMPEVGSVCWFCVPSDNPTKGFVIGWGMPHEAGSYRSGRELLNPGDLHFSSRDGNFIYIRRGGIIQIGATPLCQTVYLPIRNIVQHFCENYEIHTPGGDLTWTVNRQDEDKGGHKGTVFTLAAHEYADDPVNKDPIALLKVGSHGDGNPTILTLRTLDSGGGVVQTELKIDKTGEVTWQVQKQVKFQFLDGFNLLVGKDAVLSAGQNFNIGATQDVGITGANISLSAGGSTAALGSSGASLDGAAVNLGDATFPAVVASTSFQAWVAAVTALLTGAAAGVPVVTAGPGNLPLAPPFTSTKVKA
jgi:hypothetical protein